MTIAAPDAPKELSAVTGIPESRVGQVYRRARESDLIPKSRGKNIAELDSSHIVLLLLGAIADVPVHRTPDAAKLYYGLRDSEGNRAGDVVARMLDSFDPRKLVDEDALNVSGLCYRSHVTIDLESPRITLVHERTGETPIETVYGVKIAKSQDGSVSTSKRISGKCLFELAALLNRDHWVARERAA